MASAAVNRLYGTRGVQNIDQLINQKLKKSKLKIVRTYEYQKSMLYAIQALTGEQTHDIIANLVSEADKHLGASDIDLSLSPRENQKDGGYGYDRRVSKCMYYPGTELYIGLYVTYTSSDGYYNTDGEYTLRYNFKFPSSSLKMDQKKYDDYITDGILCDSSKDIEKPVIKGTLTKEEAELSKIKSRQRSKEKAAQKRLALAKKKKAIR